MKKVNRFVTVSFMIVLLLLYGCSKQAVNTDQINILEAKITELENKIETQQKTIETQQKTITKLEGKVATKIDLEELKNDIDVLHWDSNANADNIRALQELADSISTSKTALINEVEIIGEYLHLTITYTNFVSDDYSPNRFHLEETGEGTKTLTISKDVPIFLLENAHYLVPADWEKVVRHRGLLKLYEIDGKVVYISERYIP